jgi:purine/pyrimidine-nucleoside phosphorylase
MTKIENVNVVLKANIYFEGKVVSHAVEFKDGSKKTIGIIYPGTYNFGTKAPERMELIAGACRVRLKGAADWKTYEAGTFFDVPGDSAFDITVEKGIMEYLCSYLK